MMLQDHSRYKAWAPSARKKWKGNFRIISFWVMTPFAVTIVLVVIAGNMAQNGMTWWDTFNQTRTYSSELVRCFICSIITVMDLLIVMQDWDFPEFDNDAAAINLPGMSITDCKCSLRKCCKNTQKRKRKSYQSIDVLLFFLFCCRPRLSSILFRCRFVRYCSFFLWM